MFYCPHLRRIIYGEIAAYMQSIPQPQPVPTGNAIVLQFASDSMDEPEISVNQAGGPMSVAPIGLGGSWWVAYPEDATDLAMTSIPFETNQGHGAVVPRDATIVDFYANWTLGNPNNYEEDTTGTIHAIIARSAADSTDYIPIPETRIDFTPEITILDIYSPVPEENPVRSVRSGGLTGLNVPVAAGDRLLVVFWITGSAGIYLASKLGAGVSLV